ncbi:MAG: diguanylate cyclase [Rhodocyclales bacterium]|nr:diguanylate cyclase [Rhodocyclales bacterium]
MQHSRRLLARQKQQLDEAQQLANLGSWELDLAADSLIWSEASHRIFENGPATRASNYQGFLAAIHPDDRATVDQAYRDSVARHAPGEIVHRVLLADGRIKYVHVRWQTRYDASGKALRSLGSVQDVTERKALEAQQRLAASVFESAHEGICITDPAERIIDVNATFCETTGYARADVIGKTPRLLKAGRQSEHEERLERIAHYDALTGIPNRSLLPDRMLQAIAQTGRSAGLLAVCYLDLDGFKAVNDSLGHEAGDRLLVETAFRLRYCVRAGDTVARLGGDEFVLLLLGLAQTEECEAALQRILEALNRPVEVAAGHSTHISASIGVTLYPKDNTDADTLLRHADHAMYQAKQKGKNRYEFFAATTNDKSGSPD